MFLRKADFNGLGHLINFRIREKYLMINNKYRIIKPSKVLVNYGPITMSVIATTKGKPNTKAAIMAAKAVLTAFEELVNWLPVARKSVYNIKKKLIGSCPEVLKRMIYSVYLLQEGDFTPMAAVAGTFSDIGKEAAIKAGADKVIVNNGGDVALYVQNGLPLKVGIVSNLARREVTHFINVYHYQGIGGIATSGFGGRSLTKGVASAVTVFALNGSLADAAATSIANATNCEDVSVKRCKAEVIDYLTDLKGHLVTCSVGTMQQESVNNALFSGIERARYLFNNGMIGGAIIFVQDKIAKCPKNLILRCCEN